MVRGQGEFDKIRNYLEENPVRAGLVREAPDYRWSSAARGDRVARGPGGPPRSDESASVNRDYAQTCSGGVQFIVLPLSCRAPGDQPKLVITAE